MIFMDQSRGATGALIKGLCRPTLEGLENVPLEGPVIVASNHLSFLDSIIVQTLLPRRVAFFAKAEYFTGKGVKGAFSKWFFSTTGSIPVHRGEQAASVAALQTALEVLDAGDAFGIYPEGTRSRDGKLYRGRTGVGWLALTTGAPVLPIGLIGTEKLQPAGKNFIKPQHFTMRVGRPLFFDKVGPDHDLPSRRETTDAIMDAIAALSEQGREAKYNKSPSTE